MTDRDLMQQALDALRQCEFTTPPAQRQIVKNALAALNERLAQPEQEPVAWGCNRYIEDDNGFQIGTDEPELAWGKFAPNDNGWWPLYTALQPAQPLTNEQLEVMAEKYVTNCYFDTLKFARAIEAAHGIK